MYNYQTRVFRWIQQCFGSSAEDKTLPRAHRFLEEALELAQVAGCTAEDAHKLVDYTFARPVGEAQSEIGGVMLTLASLATTLGQDMECAGEEELIKNYGRMEKIRAKAASKEAGSPLPGLITGSVSAAYIPVGSNLGVTLNSWKKGGDVTTIPGGSIEKDELKC